MNIFFLHTNPRKCARWHCDKHVVKMLLETCQLLYTCHWMVMGALPDTAPCRTGTTQRGYKSSHMNHPCAKWTRQSLAHYRWLSSLGLELLREYRFRYHQKAHACAPHIEWLAANPPLELTKTTWTEPPCAMPDLYKSGDPVASYRRYYIGEKKHFLHYTRRHRPHWLPDCFPGVLPRI